MALALACSGPESPDSWVRSAATAHSVADEAFQIGDFELGLRAIETWLASLPPPSTPRALARQLRQDAWFRAASTLISMGRSADALRACASGLALGKEPDDAVANLLIAQGMALAAQGRSVDAADSFAAAQRIKQAQLGEILEAPPSAASDQEPQ